MARFARVREIRLHVIGAGGALEIRHMAGRAGCIGRRQSIIIVYVARRAGCRGMRAGERKARAGMIEYSAAPSGRRRMARFAGVWKIRLHVVGTDCALEIRHVARGAECVGRGQIEIIVDVARGTSSSRVRARERKACGAVIKRARGPRSCRVASLAVGGKSPLQVIRGAGAPEVRHVAGGTRGVRCGQIEVAVHMARRARNTSVRAGERKSRGAMVKPGIQEGIHAVAGFAIGGKPGGDVVGR